MAWFAAGFFLGLIGLLLVYFLPAANTNDKEAAFVSISEKYDSLPIDFEKNNWFYLTDSREQMGPIRFEDLKDCWNAGAIHNATFAWSKGMLDWKTVEELNLPLYWKNC